MQIETSFDVAAPPDQVFAFLLEVNRVVGCMPGAELTEVVDPNTFNGKVRIKVGPITVAYNGTATITDRDEANRTAKLEAKGRETTGPGGAEATAIMSVTSSNGASTVKIATDYVVRGRVANFGRGVMEDVSRRLVGQMADCIKAQLEGSAAGPAQASASAPVTAEAPPSQTGSGAVPEASPTASPPAAQAMAAPARPVNALALFFAVLGDRIRRLFRRA